MFTKAELKRFLGVLKIYNDITKVSVKDVNKAFRKLAKVTHPDKVGDEKTSVFQALLYAYDNLKDYFKEKQGISDEDIFETDEEEDFFRKNFEKFNFPFANQGSFTVNIEDHLADTWQKCMEDILGEPMVYRNPNRTECDRSWKVYYGKDEKIQITIHIYNNPKNKKGSKIMLQGSCQSLLCSYVFEELPRIYKKVCEYKPLVIEESNKSKKVTKARQVVKCDNCKFKASLIQMKMHMKTVHGPKPTRSSKRHPDFTPHTISTKKIRADMGLDTTVMLNDTFTGKNVMVAIESEHPEISCDICDECFSSQHELSSHIEGMHKKVNHILVEDLSLVNVSIDKEIINQEIIIDDQNINSQNIHGQNDNFYCTSCAFTFEHESQLDNHIESTHTMTQNSLPESVVICGTCGEGFQTLNDYDEHVPSHIQTLEDEIGNTKESCIYCNTEFSSKLLLERHVETDHDRNQHKCIPCDLSFDTKELLDKHILFHNNP